MKTSRGSRSLPFLAAAVMAVSVLGAPGIRAQQTCQPRMDQDPELNNLVHPEGYETAEPDTLGNVIRLGDGPRDMVLIAGAGFGGEVFRSFMEANREHFTMHAVTLAGFAGTPAPPMPEPGTSYGEQTWTRGGAKAVARLIEEESLERPIVVGHWVTATQVALRLAVDRPDLVSAAVVISGVPGFVATGRGSGGAQGPRTLEQRAAWSDYMASTWFKTVMRHTWDDNNYLPRDYAIHPLRGLQLWQSAAQPTLPVWVRYLSEMWAYDSTADLDRLEIPVLIVKPSLDKLYFEGPQTGPHLNAFLHDGWAGVERRSDLITVATIDDARVFVMDDQPEALNRAVLAFADGPGAQPRRAARTPRLRPASAGSDAPPRRSFWGGDVEQQGNRFLVAGASVSVERPDDTWELEGVAGEAPVVARMQDDQDRAKVSLQIHPVFGTPLEVLPAAIEQSLRRKYPTYEQIASEKTTLDGHDGFSIDGTYDEDGARMRTRIIFAMLADGNLFSVAFRASPDDFDAYRPQFDTILRSLDLTTPN